mmetsp:Transcript_35632/g.92891  ORF Transcript_35632/g.92891 Transcript_35632/m.92891 type:complete len:226 (-) Transcript_35632:359-1036(-)|eukprot:CAMPEP_0113879296 /NCGR_PEP_ID=MMETSP0780_2-20120614/7162_1 /TAXON_ID=652834 /ORGANISM="Palpitomonas bilix" /LENGTH=225 /DNA_ID=CAMNT_0000865867 /DNA_START=682 /DNA_END=1359 /DNA_ORIENTATION=+ /assembly_acc=CAM_ASM_000599
MATDYDSLFKLVLIGDSGVGKTSILTRFAENTFQESFISTVGVDFRVRTLNVKGRAVKLQIWDTAGQERFRTITSAYYRGADGIVVVFDLTNEESFDHVETWFDEIERYCSSSVSKIIIGNKHDLDDQRQVTAEQAKEFAARVSSPYIETSAKTDKAVEDAFMAMASSILEERAQPDNNTIWSGLQLETDLAKPSACEKCFGCFNIGKKRSVINKELLGGQQEDE